VKSNKYIRIARPDDSKQILEIYKPFILNSATTFEEEVPGLEDFKNRITTTLEECPYLVCEIDGEIAGYAYASAYRSRAAYRWDREVSVYVHPNFRRQNIAKALYGALIPILNLQGFVKLFGVITLPNQGSIALHESMGFQKMTEYRDVGYKMNQWHHVGWWELTITENLQNPPGEIIPFSTLKLNNKVAELMENARTLLFLEG
jgi:phosphinothricin acetyltransferase